MEQNSLSKIKLTVSQKKVLDQILNFIANPATNVFILKGYAGTGKTTLMRYLIKELDDKDKTYRLLASTGRAAKILSNLSGNSNIVSTIHSMVYSFNGLNTDIDEKEAEADKDGQLFLVFEPAVLNKKKTPETVYIIDEASMISDVASKDITQAKFGEGRLLKDLLDFDNRPASKFIFIGDPCQLPPIEEYFSPALTKEYFNKEFGIDALETQLTEILRQKDNSGIVEASKQIRGLYSNAPESRAYYGAQKLWGFLPFRKYKDIQLHDNLEEMIDNYVDKIKKYGLNSAVCICRRNKDCNLLSTKIRPRLGHISENIEKGDLLMVIQNNMATGLMNGDMVTIQNVSSNTERRAGLTFRQITVKETFTGNTFTTLAIEDTISQTRLNLDKAQQQALFVDFIMRMRKKNINQKNNKKRFYDEMLNDPYLNALRCVYGYAITCHKSQGGEWEDVYIHVPRNITLNPTKETYQWIYTSMTRAQNKLHLISDFFIR